MATDKNPHRCQSRKIWVDLDNSPHVPFFVPIIEELERRGHTVLVTARDCFQVCELADLLGLKYRRMGRHYGKNKVLKLVGLGVRTLQLAPLILSEKPDLAISHGSRAQLLTSLLVGTPSIVIIDYEFARGLTLMRPAWVMVPAVIPDAAIQFAADRILRYPGIKEDVYVPRFRPDLNLKMSLGLTAEDIMVTLRPPASEAHYHNPQSEQLLDAVIGLLHHNSHAKAILLPRNHSQEVSLRKTYSDLFATKKLIVPERAVDGLSLIWHSDLVISGGGTMNREAAALGIPVYSIFRGRIGAVDRYLSDTGRLVLVESIDEIRRKIVLKRRPMRSDCPRLDSSALGVVIDNIEEVMGSQYWSTQGSIQ